MTAATGRVRESRVADLVTQASKGDQQAWDAAALTAACPVGVGRGDEPPPPSPWPGTEGEHHHDGGSSNRGAPRRDQVKALVPGWGVPAGHRCRT
jgi:hypothetical protein